MGTGEPPQTDQFESPEIRRSLDAMARRAEATLAKAANQDRIVLYVLCSLREALKSPASRSAWHDVFWDTLGGAVFDAIAADHLHSVTMGTPDTTRRLAAKVKWMREAVEYWKSRPDELPDDDALGRVDHLDDPARLSSGICEEVAELLGDAEAIISKACSTPDGASVLVAEALLALSFARFRWLRFVGREGNEESLTALDRARRSGTLLLLQIFERRLAGLRRGIDAGAIDIDPQDLMDRAYTVTDGFERSYAAVMALMFAESAQQPKAPDLALDDWSVAFALLTAVNWTYTKELSEYKLGPEDRLWSEFRSFPLQEIVDLFEQRKQARDGDWNRLVPVVDTFVNTNVFDEYPVEPNVEMESGYTMPWGHYWRTAESFMRGKLDPEHLSHYFANQDVSDAEKRLQRYFLSTEEWMWMPEKARRLLGSVDHAFVTSGPRNTPSILADLANVARLVAMKATWEPVSAWVKARPAIDPTRPEGLKRAVRALAHALAQPTLRDPRDEPSLQDIEQLCATDGLDIALRALLPNDDIAWVTQVLPSKLRALRQARNMDTHRSDFMGDAAAISELYAEMIGAAREGVLPRLIRCGIKLSERG